MNFARCMICCAALAFAGCAGVQEPLYEGVRASENANCRTMIDTERERCEARTAMSYAQYREKQCELLTGDERQHCLSALTSRTIPPYQRASR